MSNFTGVLKFWQAGMEFTGDGNAGSTSKGSLIWGKRFCKLAWLRMCQSVKVYNAYTYLSNTVRV